MRLLYINSQLVDIDDQTSIGIDFQAYDLKEPSKRKVNVSNAFTLPKTANNMAIFGHAGNPQSIDDTVYTIMSCDYWIDNFHIIQNNSVRIEEISDRISLYVSSKNNIWDDLKLLTWSGFLTEYLDWLEDIKGTTIRQTGNNNLETFLTNFTSATDDIVLPFYYGNYLANPTAVIEDIDHIELDRVSYRFSDGVITGIGAGGHLCIFIKSLFEFIEYKYTVNFCTSESGITGNIWDDAIAPTVYTPARNMFVRGIYTAGASDVTGYALEDATTYTTIYSGILQHPPIEGVADKADKTLFDCVNAFMQKFNIIVDEITLTDNTKAFRLARFDDIETLAAVTDFGLLTGQYSFKPSISGYAQNNIIKIKALYPEADAEYFSRNIECLNKNLEIKKELFSIDEYIAAFKAITGDVIPDLSIQESFKTFQFFVTTATSTDIINIRWYGFTTSDIFDKTATLNLQIPAHYSLASEYLFLEEIIQKPKVYTVKKWLGLRDIFELEFFKQYYIKELNGCFYINKISGFNPQKSNEPTTIELIRISDKTPAIVYDSIDYFIDNDEEFTDGLGNYFY